MIKVIYIAFATLIAVVVTGPETLDWNRIGYVDSDVVAFHMKNPCMKSALSDRVNAPSGQGLVTNKEMKKLVKRCESKAGSVDQQTIASSGVGQ
jgi:hypothetical protein